MDDDQDFEYQVCEICGYDHDIDLQYLAPHQLELVEIKHLEFDKLNSLKIKNN